MASTYDKASLVMIPSGIKEGKLFSQKPVNGDGDFTFSRSTAATRVNADGNIEKETQNLLLQSNSFDVSANWVNTFSSETSGHTGYDGSSDAWLLTKTDASGRIHQNFTASGVMTYSVYLKANASNYALMQLNGTGADKYMYIDLTNGTKGSSGGGNIDENIVDVGNGWYRCSVTANTDASRVRIYPANSTGDVSATSGSIYIQDAQVEYGLVARDYIETTTAAVEGGITDNVPRLDYTDSSCPALLLEPQRRNLVPHSEYLGSLTGLTASYVESPEGLNNATRLTENTATSQHYSSINVSGIVIGQTYALSFYIRKGTYDNVVIYTQSSLMSSTASITFSTETISAGGAVAGSPFMNSVGNGWYRCGYVGTAIGSGSMAIYATVLNLNSGVGDGTSYIDYYGFQVEDNGAGGGTSYATSYIPTYGTSVTRGVDFSSNNDLVDTPIAIGANDDFALYYEGSFDKDGRNDMIMGGGVVGAAADSKCYWWVRDSSLFLAGNGETTMAYASFTAVKNTNYKLLVKRNGSVIDTFVNGTKLSTTQGVTNTAFTFRSLGWSYSNATYKISGNIKQAMIFKTGLTDQEAIDLTTI